MLYRIFSGTNFGIKTKNWIRGCQPNSAPDEQAFIWVCKSSVQSRCHASAQLTKNTVSQKNKNYEKINNLQFSANIGPKNLSLSSDVKKMLSEKTFNVDEEVITKKDAYFDANISLTTNILQRSKISP